ncbi:MAG: DUF3124 domain-containing protein, partial [Myxococcota bacterium]
STAAKPFDAAALRQLGPQSELGELVYVATYSGPFHPARIFDFTVTLTIHNVAIDREIEVLSVTYVDQKGTPKREFAPKPITLGPLEARHFTVPPNSPGWSNGANFLVKWQGKKGTPRPLIEALMLTTQSQQGISFISRGRVIERLSRADITPE